MVYLVARWSSALSGRVDERLVGKQALELELGDIIVVMSARPASVDKIILIEREDRDRADRGYAGKMTEALRALGVKTDLSHD